MSSRFDLSATPLVGLVVAQRKLVGDDRGFLDRLYCADEMQSLFHGKGIVQVNHTGTKVRGTVRGLHFQYPPQAEVKLVSCLRGAVFDVAVDIRRDSPSFLRWHAEVLSAENHKSLLIPEGFAHGFQTLEEDCELFYLHTAAHVPEAEAGLHPRDPRLGIAWPLSIAMLSQRDAGHAYLDDAFAGVTV